MRRLLPYLGLAVALGLVPAAAALAGPPVDDVDPLIGSAGGGNTFPGAVVPFGMVQWSPETTRGDATRAAAPGGYAYDARRVRGFGLTHLSGTGCRGAAGDIPFMPYAGAVATSPSADVKDQLYATRFSHANEAARAGRYEATLESGIKVELSATPRTGAGSFSLAGGKPLTLLLRVSDSEVGSSAAEVTLNAQAHTVSGSVTSGNFCGYLDAADRRSYYTLYFVAVFDRPWTSGGTWEDGTLHAGAEAAHGGTGYGADGAPVPGKGSGAWVTFDATVPVTPAGAATAAGAAAAGTVGVRVGISYVSVANAAANLRLENPDGTSFDDVAARARNAWEGELRRIEVAGGTPAQRTTFYTALYHALLHPNLFSDASGEYQGFDGQRHKVRGSQHAQYANFSGWDVYRSQLQLVALIEPEIAADIAQSLLNQAAQNGGEWDRWTHNNGATHVMEGDPSPAAIAGIAAFGGSAFDLRGAFASLARAATMASSHDGSADGCPVECPGQRPALDRWLTLHYIPAGSNAWGGAGETLEDAIADFSLAQLAARLGDDAARRLFLQRSGYWRNVWNPAATPHGGYIQDRAADGTWPAFDAASDDGFAEGSSAQYSWMVPFDVRGLFDAMGGNAAASRRLDAFFHRDGGEWALTGLGGLHAELDNEPSIGAPWLYLYTGEPWKAQEIVRQAINRLWSPLPYGIPGNDDLGEISSWYVWSAMGLYPGIPGRAELLLGSPLFPSIVVHRANRRQITISAPRAAADRPFVHRLRLDGQLRTQPWLPDTFVADGGRLDFELSEVPDKTWGAAPTDQPPSFPPPPAPPAATAVLAARTATPLPVEIPPPAHRLPARCDLRPSGDQWAGTCALFEKPGTLTLRRVAAVLSGRWRGDAQPIAVWSGEIPLSDDLYAMIELEMYPDGSGVLRSAMGWLSVTDFALGAAALSFTVDASRRVAPSDLDRRILARAATIITSEAVWNRADDSQCPAAETTWSIYCALVSATREITGASHQRRPAFELVRQIVDERRAGRLHDHNLVDYNNDPATRLADVQSLFAEALARAGSSP